MVRYRLAVFALSTAISAPTGICFGQGVQDRQIPLGTNQVEDFSWFAGRWQADGEFRQAEGPKPRFVRILEITTSPTEIRVNRGYAPIESYRLDGTSTEFGDGRTGSAVLAQEGIVLTTRRTDRPSVTIHSDLYRVAGDVLTLQARRSQAQPDGTLVQMENTAVSIVYRRMP